MKPGAGDSSKVTIDIYRELLKEGSTSQGWMDRLAPLFNGGVLGKLSARLKDSSPLEILWLEERIRSSWWGNSNHNVTSLQIYLRLRPTVFEAGLASLHGSGYMREAAVDVLAAFDTGEELPFLLIRCGDWVKEVSTKAQSAVASRLVKGRSDDFVCCVELVDRMGRLSRRNAKLRERIEAFYSSPECSDALLSGCVSESPSMRQSCLVRALSARVVDPMQVLNIAGGDKHPSIRLWAARNAEKHGTDMASFELLSRLVADKAASVRRKAVVILSVRFTEKAASLIGDLRFDPSPDIREHARASAGLSRKADADLYRKVLSSPIGSRLVGSLEGLGETGTRDDLKLTGSFNSHPVARVRLAALRVRWKLDPDHDAEWTIVALRDASGLVIWAAARHWLARRFSIADSILWSLMNQKNAVGRGAALMLAAHLPKWQGTLLLLRMIVEGDTESVRFAERRLASRNWNSDQSSPSREQFAAVKAYMKDERIPAVLRRELEFNLRAFA